MASVRPRSKEGAFRVLAVVQGLWGERIADHVRGTAPDWHVSTWSAPAVLPPLIDDPDDYLPETLPQADLLLALGDNAGLAQMVPDIVERCGASAVIAPIDRNCSLPPGLARQLTGWLEAMNVEIVFPKPFCSLTEDSYNRPPIQKSYDNPLIRRFAQRYGRPQFETEVQGDRIGEVVVLRGTPCGSARHVGEKIIGTASTEAVDSAAMLLHHYPCLASMDMDTDYLDTLMHESGNIMKESFRESIRAQVPQEYIRPSGHVGEDVEDQIS
jgi:hypothetical protein